MTDYHIANDYYIESTRLGRTDIDYLKNCFENIARRTSCTARLLFHYNSALLTSGPPGGLQGRGSYLQFSSTERGGIDGVTASRISSQPQCSSPKFRNVQPRRDCSSMRAPPRVEAKARRDLACMPALEHTPDLSLTTTSAHPQRPVKSDCLWLYEMSCAERVAAAVNHSLVPLNPSKCRWSLLQWAKPSNSMVTRSSTN